MSPTHTLTVLPLTMCIPFQRIMFAEPTNILFIEEYYLIKDIITTTYTDIILFYIISYNGTVNCDYSHTNSIKTGTT